MQYRRDLPTAGTGDPGGAGLVFGPAGDHPDTSFCQWDGLQQGVLSPFFFFLFPILTVISAVSQIKRVSLCLVSACRSTCIQFFPAKVACLCLSNSNCILPDVFLFIRPNLLKIKDQMFETDNTEYRTWMPAWRFSLPQFAPFKSEVSVSVCRCSLVWETD